MMLTLIPTLTLIPEWGTFSQVKATLVAPTFREGRKQQFCMCLFKSYIATIDAPTDSVVISTQTPI